MDREPEPVVQWCTLLFSGETVSDDFQLRFHGPLRSRDVHKGMLRRFQIRVDMLYNIQELNNS